MESVDPQPVYVMSNQGFARLTELIFGRLLSIGIDNTCQSFSSVI